MRSRWLDRLVPKRKRYPSYLRSMVTGSIYRVSDIRGNTSLEDIKTQIDVMRALARDSQISTALSYYATDATTVNTNGQIIWAVGVEEKYADVADVINKLFKRWRINDYARDHILELATIGNLYLATTDTYKSEGGKHSKDMIALDNNTIPDDIYDIVPSTKIPPENVLHLYKDGEPQGFLFMPDEKKSDTLRYPEASIIHFSLGGLLGDYSIEAYNTDREIETYNIKFAQPLMEKAVQPTQTLNLLEDALLLSSLNRTVKFVNVDCGGSTEETEIQATLQQMKNAVEQQLSLNTNDGSVESFVNPQSPNNLIFLPRPNGNDLVTVTDLNMADATEQDSKLLQYYQDKKLSVLGVPKEAMNFSSNEGLGGAGSVLSQRSAIYANALQRLETAYISGWTDAINKYFRLRGMSGMIDKFELRMNPIITTQSTITFEKRDAAISQAQTFVDLLKNLNVSDDTSYLTALSEILSEALPRTGSDILKLRIKVDESEAEEGTDDAGF